MYGNRDETMIGQGKMCLILLFVENRRHLKTFHYLMVLGGTRNVHIYFCMKITSVWHLFQMFEKCN